MRLNVNVQKNGPILKVHNCFLEVHNCFHVTTSENLRRFARVSMEIFSP